MGPSLLRDAFAHHVWATNRVLDTCAALSPEQLDTAVAGTYGSILETLRHLVRADGWYLFVASGDRTHILDADRSDLQELRAAMKRHGRAWSQLLVTDLDPDTILREVDDDDGYERHAPLGIQLAQALHHGTDHRSQVCTALAELAVPVPDIDAWAFGLQDGRIVEIPPTS